MLADIKNPSDLKRLQTQQLIELSEEMRAAISSYVDACGGHLASNLGAVELTVALHYVFDSPRDQIVFDVSHQCYAHKMLTGRAQAFLAPACQSDISGFANHDESGHDPFNIGHSSTAISLAVGLAHGRDLLGEHHNVVAVVGDGALSGGEAFEGLNNAAMLTSNLIIVVNDNEHSIANNVGGLYANLAILRKTNGSATHNLFHTLGFAYEYVEEGNDVLALVKVFQRVRDADRPTVIHVHTAKGKGNSWAEAHPEEAHELRPKALRRSGPTEEDRIIARVSHHLGELASSDSRVVIISPATPLSHGITPEMRLGLVDQFVDVGIAEEHALSFAVGLARAGGRPIVCVSSTFLQRAYDQLLHDVALNAVPVTILVYKAGLSDRDATHVGSFDIAFSSPIPNLVCLAPANSKACADALDWALEQTCPVMVRVPRIEGRCAQMPCGSRNGGQDWQVILQGDRVAFVTIGRVESEVLDGAVPILTRKANVTATVIRATTYATLDRKLLASLEAHHELVVVVEDGMGTGGLGERVASFYCNRRMRVLMRGGAREFTQRIPIAEQYKRYRIAGNLLADDVMDALHGKPIS